MSLVPPNTWTVEAFPPVLGLVNYGELLSSTERLRPALNSLWMAAAATLAAVVVGVMAARLSLRRGRTARARARGDDDPALGDTRAPSSLWPWRRR